MSEGTFSNIMANIMAHMWIDLGLCWSEVMWFIYDKCPKISYTEVTDKMAYANNADPDQTAPKGAVWSGSTLFAISFSILRNNCIESKI